MISIVLQRRRTVGSVMAVLFILLAALVPTPAFAQDNALYLPAVEAGMEMASAAGAAGAPAKTAVYVMTNQPDGNAVALFRRGADGMLAAAGNVPTGGLGTGAGIGSQGSLALSDNGQWLLAVNPGSNDISVLAVRPDGLVLVDRAASGGVLPLSVTNHKDVVYVLNGGESGNITGFRLGSDGKLTPLAGSTRPLSNNGVGAAPGPAQVSFSQDGKALVVTEKATNLLDTYSVDMNGIASGPVTTPSSGATPFGFAFTRQGTLVVSEAFGGAADASAASSYRLTGAGLQLVSGSVPTGQTAACWVAVTKDGKYAYTTNAGSGSVSAYEVHPDGSLTLIDGRAGVTGDGATPIDAMVSHDGRFLYVLNAGAQSISAFAVQADGRLVSIGTATGLPVGAVGMAVW